MHIFRVEGNGLHRDYKGPYAFFSEQEIHGPIANTRAWRDTHPLPPTERLWVESRKDSGDYRYGFISLEQLHAWFEERARQWLANQGFEIVIWEVPENAITFGRYQVSYGGPIEVHFVETLPLWEEDDL
jgi:hypothetical protein